MRIPVLADAESSYPSLIRVPLSSRILGLLGREGEKIIALC